METLGDKNLLKFCSKFYCQKCDYRTSKTSSYNDHLLSAKHIKPHIGDTIGDGGDINSAGILPSKKTFVCEVCNKSYLSRNGLWKHNKHCKIDSNLDTEENIVISTNEISEKDLIMLIVKQNTELIKENSEFKNMMMEVIKNGTNTNSHNNNTISTNSHNKAFNLQFFLNETCKDAMNITDFVESMGGSGDNMFEKEEKIIAKVSKEVTVDKEAV